MRFWRGRIFLSRHWCILCVSGIASATLATTAFAGGALPTNGKVVAGSASVAKGANGLTVNQSTSRAIIDWNSFSIGAGNAVYFNNGNGATLNKVTGNSLSQIDGFLSSTGSVFLINPNGVVIGSGGKIITNGSFVVSTRDLLNNAFLSGSSYEFAGMSSGTIANEGTITSTGGDVVLVGKSVTNSGTISAPQGTAALAAGDDVTLKPVDGDQRISIAAGTGSVTNTGSVNAAAAELKAADGNVYALAGNSGVMHATGTDTVGGHIWLTSNGGDVQVTGTASASNADGSGGTVTVRGASIEVPGTIDASATAGGKSGGTASVIATGTTTVTGTIKAEGGQGATGGFIETSGATLDIGDSARISTYAPGGITGIWLIDPTNFVIAAAGGDATGSFISSELNGGTNIDIESSAGSGGSDGNVIVNDQISWSTAAKLTLGAVNDIDINADITISGGGSLVMNTGVSGDDVIAPGNNISYTGGPSSGASLTINGGHYTLLYSMSDLQALNSTNGALEGTYALATSLDASATTNWTPIGVDSEGRPLFCGCGFTGVLDGLGHSISNLTVNLPTLPNVGLFGHSEGAIANLALIGGSFTGQSSVGGLVGYNDGSIVRSSSSATVSASGGDVGGLVGYNDGDSVIYGSYATGRVTSSGGTVGGFAGYNNGEIYNSYATGAVNGAGNYVGGFVGYADYTSHSFYSDIENSYATGTVVNSSDNTGGLAGYNAGEIVRSYATGKVQAEQFAGGLVGWNEDGLVSQSYATGAVSGTTDVGGLVGDNEDQSEIANSYALGPANGLTNVGGLVGHNGDDADIEDAYSIGAVTGTTAFGGLVGSNDSGATISVGYWDTQTSGLLNGVGTDANNQSANLTGATTALLLNTLGGYSASTWATGPGLLPYLQWQYSSGTPQAVAGFAYSDNGATPLASSASGAVAVSALINGATLGTVYTGANGYYYILAAPESLTGTQDLLTYVNGNIVNANTFVQSASGNTEADLYGNTLRVFASGPTASDVFGAIDTARGSFGGNDFLSSGATITPGATLDLELGNIGGFVFDLPVVETNGTIIVNASGTVTQSAALTASYLDLRGTNDSYTLTNPANSIGVLAGLASSNGGTLDVATSGALTIGAAGQDLGIAGFYSTAISSAGAMTLDQYVNGRNGLSFTSGGNFTIASGAGAGSGAGNVTIAASGAFVNNEGSDAVSAAGHWLIYSVNPSEDSFDNLDSNSTAVWDTAAGASVSATGDRYVFAYQPNLTVTTMNVSKEYGANGASAVAAAYTITGAQSGVNGAFLGDTASAIYSGAPAVTSSGSAATASVAGGPYAVIASAGSLAASDGYTIAYDNAGELTVTARPITIAANDLSKVYGTSDPMLTYSVGGDGLVNGDALTGALTRVSGETVSGGPYAIEQGSLAASSNYAVIFTGGEFTITPATLIASLTGTVEKTYDGTTAATLTSGNYSLSGIVGADSVGLIPVAGVYAGKNVGSGIAVSVNGLVLTGADASNYVLASSSASAAIGTIDPASLTITADNIVAVNVDDAMPTAHYSGFVAGEGPSLVSGLAFAIIPTASATLFSVLPHGATAPNYDISFVAGALAVPVTPFEIPGTSVQIWDLTEGNWPGQMAGFDVLPIILDNSGYDALSLAPITTDDATGDEYVFTSGALLPRFDIDFTALLKILDTQPHLKTASL